LYAVPAAHGSFPTLSLKVFPWMLDPLPRRYTVCSLLQCLDHLFVFGEAHLRRAMSAYVAYYNHWRPHRSLCQRASYDSEVLHFRSRETSGKIIAEPVLGGLHHIYRCTAWPTTFLRPSPFDSRSVTLVSSTKLGQRPNPAARGWQNLRNDKAKLIQSLFQPRPQVDIAGRLDRP
jgi:hypothetical protein